MRLRRNDDCRGCEVVSRLKTRVFALRTCMHWSYAAARRSRGNSALSYKRRIASLSNRFSSTSRQAPRQRLRRQFLDCKSKRFRGVVKSLVSGELAIEFSVSSLK
jgi:hypothetical protein